MLKKIISGGQTGADQGGLEAGRALGLETGGTAPWNWKTENGIAAALLTSYGLVPGPYDPYTYPKRTERNVKDSDATIIFGDAEEKGSALTYRLAHEKYKKPVLVIEQSGTVFVQIRRFITWLADNNVQVLNVAGNRESKSPGIQAFVRKFVIMALNEGVK